VGDIIISTKVEKGNIIIASIRVPVVRKLFIIEFGNFRAVYWKWLFVISFSLAQSEKFGYQVAERFFKLKVDE
jgi:hypothetical protein